MLEKFLGLKIKGRCFAEETELKFFLKSDNGGKDPYGKDDDNPPRVSLVFGRNGSGKSTVSRTFASLADHGKLFTDMTKADPIPRGGASAADVEIAKLSPIMHVFNEDYVQEKIVLKGNQTDQGLETIIMFGAQGPIDKMIEAETKNKEKLEADIKVCTDLKTELEKPENPMSPTFIKEHIIKAILQNKKLYGWAYREGKALGWGKAQSVDENTITEIMKRAGENAPDVNINVFMQKLAALDQARKYKDKDLPLLDIGAGLDFDETALLALLNRRVESVNLSERDKRIIAVIAEFGQPWMKQVEAHINKDGTTHCPCCQRPLTPDEKTYAVESIEAALKAALTIDVEDYKAALRNFALPTLPRFVFDNYRLIAPDLVKTTEYHLGELTALYERYRQDIVSRLGNIHGTPQFTSHGFAELKAKLLKDLGNLKTCRDSFELAKQRINALKSELQELNYKIAKNEIKDAHDQWEHQKKVLADNETTLADLKLKLDASEKEIARLQAEKKNIKIARDRINQALKYIFLSDSRIQIEAEGDIYKIKSNGKPVAPQDISVGERNALALCYFFSDMLEQSEETKAYDTERLIVLDDPVSSFDHENKMGVLSYIMFEIENLTCTLRKVDDKWIRPETRVICMVHELYTYFALANALQSHDNKASEPKIGTKLYSLDCRKTGLVNFPWKIENINEYRKNFDEIMAYAELKDPTPDIHVGNQTRRLLEAFSTFVFRQGIEYLFYTEEIIKDAHKSDFHRYFKEVFSRFVVNDESHLQGRIRSLTNGNCLLPFIHQNAQQRAVRDAICLIYLIMPEHILSLFENGDVAKAKQAVIDKWVQKILEDAPAKVGGTAA